MSLIHQHWKPYADVHVHLNLFDGDILHLIILVSFIPLVELSNSVDSTLLKGTIYIVALSPLIGLITMKLWIHRNNIRVMIVYCGNLKCICKHTQSRNSDEIPLNDCETQWLIKKLWWMIV